MEKITFFFKDLNFKDALQQIIGFDPSYIKIYTHLYKYKPMRGDVIIAYSAEHNIPLTVHRKGRIKYYFDISKARQFYFTDSKRPVYTYIPFLNIRHIPPAIRRPISNLLASKNFSFDRSEDAIDYYCKLPLNANDFITILLNAIERCYFKIDKPIYRWPNNKKAAFISLHDVDSSRLIKLGKKDPLLNIVNKHQIKGTWFFLTTILKHMNITDLAFLADEGHELGWHGYNHDHRLPFGKYTRKRIEHLNQSFLIEAHFYPLGMRTPKLLKTNHLFSSLETYCRSMCYDTSFQVGITPYYFFNNTANHQILEIPTTVPTDIRLYNELVKLPNEKRYETILNIQIERTKRLIDVGALISIATHPESDITEKPELLDVFNKYLSYLRSRDDIWFTTAGSIYKYWRENQHNDR